MARARGIKPGLYKNEDLAECSVWARYIFPGLWMLADREGRLEDRPKRIKGELLPFDAQDVEPLLRELATRGFILRYEIDGQRCIQILKFKEHQSPHYSEKESVIKPPVLPESKPHISPPDSGNSPPTKQGQQPPSSLIPSSPTADSGLSDSPTPDKSNPVATPLARRRAPNGERAEPKGAPAWNAYAQAYHDRWGTDPVRNAQSNTLMAQLVDRVGAEEAPQVAAFFVRSNHGAYVSRRHPVKMLVADAEGLRTQWATNRSSTQTAAMQTDRTAAQGDVFRELKQEYGYGS